MPIKKKGKARKPKRAIEAEDFAEAGEAAPGREKKPLGSEDCEGLAVHAWVDTARASWEAGVDERTLYNWRAVGIPAKQEKDGTWWYPLPHLHVWHGVLIYRQAARYKEAWLSFPVALAHHRLLNAEFEDRHSFHPSAPRRGRHSFTGS